jgi:hypothetical protein
MKRKRRKPKCSRCRIRKSKDQFCQFTGVGFFNVALAERIIRNKPRKAVKLSRAKLLKMVSKQNHPDHVHHVNMKKFGIIGQTEDAIFLMDGNHRGGNALLTGRPFFAYELSEFETGRVFMGKRTPKGYLFQNR